MAIRATIERIDREETSRAFRGHVSPQRQLAAFRRDAPAAVSGAVLRAAWIAVVAGTMGGVLAAGLVAALSGRRRVLVLGTVAALAVSILIVAGALASLRNFHADAFRSPTFYAHRGELPTLLRFSDRLLSAGAHYQSSYDEALRSVTTLISPATPGGAPPAGDEILVAPDIHSNTLPLPAFSAYADHRPVFLVGDFTQQGTPLEAALARRAAGLGHPTVAVSGNHDTPLVMLQLARAGAVVLTSQGRLLPSGEVDPHPVATVAGLGMAGYSDPLATEAFGHPLDLSPEALQAERSRIVLWYDALPRRPQIVLVHDVRIGEALLAHAGARGDQLVILTGHDHRQRVERSGETLLVDDGTLGAGGIFDVGVQAAGFAAVHLTGGGRPLAVDLIQVQPTTGDATARRIMIPAPQASRARNAGPATGAARPGASRPHS